MKKNVNNKKKTIITAVASMTLCAALLTTSAYAWFTISNKAKVDSLTLEASTTGSLQIGAAADALSDHVDLNITDLGLTPITSTDGIKFYAPIYGTDGIVSGVNSTESDVSAIKNKTAQNGGWIIQKDIYLLATTTDTAVERQVGIALVGDGTSVVNTDSKKGANCVRISFKKAGDSTATILEPNSNDTTASTQYKLSGWDTTKVIKESTAKKFASALTNQSVTNATCADSTSPELFKIKANEVTKVTVTIWLEGSDPDCVTSVAGAKLSTQLQFICTDI